jgi:hypothetical protein
MEIMQSNWAKLYFNFNSEQYVQQNSWTMIDAIMQKLEKLQKKQQE